MQRFKELLNNKNIIKAMLVGYLAAFVFVLLAFGIKSMPSEETAEEKAVEESVSRDGFTYSRPTSSLKTIAASEDDEKFVPAPDKLNLAYFFPDGADTSDSINSYGGKIYTALNSRNAEYFASYFDLTDRTPKAIASQFGLGIDRVMGKYNPNDSSQSADDPASWTVNSFRNVNVNFYDGDGNHISGYYNVQEIMALASVYAYYHEMDDYEAMQEYCETLFSASVSSKVSLGNVYYDSGCLNRTVQQEADEAIALERAQTQLEGGTGVNAVQTTGLSASETTASASEYVTVNVNDAETVPTGYAAANGDLSMTRTAAAAENNSSGGNYEERSSAVIYDHTSSAQESTTSGGGLSSKKNTWQKINDNVVVSPGTAQTEAPTTAAPEAQSEVSDTPAAVVGAADTGFADAAFASPSEDTPIFMNGAAASSLFDNVVVSPASNGTSAASSTSETPAETAAAAVSESTAAVGNQEQTSQASAQTQTSGETKTATETGTADSEKITVSQSYCPGHIDLYVSITIKGIDDKNSLFKADPIGNNKDNFNDEWQGWTEDKIELAKKLCEQDWLENYGLSISSIKVSTSLTTEQINSYLNSLSPDVSVMRKNIVEYALNSVGKIPYYWGGKPSGGGYSSNNFYTLTSPDYRGRILKGLDCSGWINWVYWSVTGHSLDGESTGTLIGCGRRIQRSELKPGDIIIRTGSDAHVVMFLCWAQNGNFIGIHETGGVINNVIVSEMTASWPYYRSLLD